MGDNSPEIRRIPEELLVFSENHNVAGLAVLAFYIHEHRYPSNEEFENAMREILRRELQINPVITIAA